MPDESLIPPTLPSDTPAPSAGSSVMPDPQKLVDEALTPSSTLPPTPTSASPEPPVSESLPPLTPSSEPAPSSSAPMSDEMPLAFAGTPTPEQASPEIAAAVASQTLPPLPTADTPIMPLPAAPLPPVMPPADTPKKKGMGKVLGAVVGLFLLLGGIAGGYWYYVNNFGETAQVAVITDPAKCSGCSKPKDGGWLVWRNGQCKVVGICNSSNPDKDTTNPVKPSPLPAGDKASCDKLGLPFCAGCGGFCNNTPDQTCNQLQVSKCGEAVSTGASCTTTPNTPGFPKACNCSGTTVYFDSNGPGVYCNSQDATGTKDPLYYDTYGLCAVYKNAGNKCGNSDSTTSAPDGTSCWEWSDSGVTIKAEGNCRANCDAVKHTCDTNTGVAGGCNTPNPATGDSQSFNGKCGQTQQIDITCNGSSYLEHRSKIYPDCEKASPKPSVSPNPSPSPTLACTSLSKDKATPKKGDKVTFTCKGTTTNAGNPTLTYQFRLRKDSGEWQSLTATGDKASYTVNAAGTYEVQCKACGILKSGAASTCDPDWSAAQ